MSKETLSRLNFSRGPMSLAGGKQVLSPYFTGYGKAQELEQARQDALSKQAADRAMEQTRMDATAEQRRLVNARAAAAEKRAQATYDKGLAEEAFRKEVLSTTPKAGEVQLSPAQVASQTTMSRDYDEGYQKLIAEGATPEEAGRTMGTAMDEIERQGIPSQLADPTLEQTYNFQREKLASVGDAAGLKLLDMGLGAKVKEQKAVKTAYVTEQKALTKDTYDKQFKLMEKQASAFNKSIGSGSVNSSGGVGTGKFGKLGMSSGESYTTAVRDYFGGDERRAVAMVEALASLGYNKESQNDALVKAKEEGWFFDVISTEYLEKLPSDVQHVTRELLTGKSIASLEKEGYFKKARKNSASKAKALHGDLQKQLTQYTKDFRNEYANIGVGDKYKPATDFANKIIDERMGRYAQPTPTVPVPKVRKNAPKKSKSVSPSVVKDKRYVLTTSAEEITPKEQKILAGEVVDGRKADRNTKNALNSKIQDRVDAKNSRTERRKQNKIVRLKQQLKEVTTATERDKLLQEINEIQGRDINYTLKNQGNFMREKYTNPNAFREGLRSVGNFFTGDTQITAEDLYTADQRLKHSK